MTQPSTENVRFELLLKQKASHSIWRRTIHLERLYIALQIPRRIPWLEMKVDTGAFLSIFPQRKWKDFQDLIQWPSAAEEAALLDWCRRFGGIAGGQVSCRLGLVTGQVIGLSRPIIESEPFPLIALFALDGGRIEKPLFGLGGGAFVPHQFRLDYAQGKAALIANSPIP